MNFVLVGFSNCCYGQHGWNTESEWKLQSINMQQLAKKFLIKPLPHFGQLQCSVRPKTRTFSFNTARNEVDRVCTHLFWPLVTELNVTVCVCVHVCVLVFKLTVVQQQWINGVLMLNDNSSTYHGISDTWPACKARTFDPTNSKPQQQLHKHHGSTLPFCYLPSKIQTILFLCSFQHDKCQYAIILAHSGT